jgi:hypothetical protein
MTKNYEDFVETTDKSNHNVQFYIDGMNEENGEISGIFKRVRRGDYGENAKNDIDQHHGINHIIITYPEIKMDVLKELGDRHWYTTRFLQEIKSSWLEAETINRDKLTKREETGTILGHGDNREQ